MPEAPRRRSTARGDAKQPASRTSPSSASQRRRPAEDRDNPSEARSPGRSDGSGSRQAPPLRQLVASARQQLEEVIGRPVSGVLGFEPADGGWQITLEVVELQRIPETTSILGCYVARLDDDGELTEYRRIRRYNRSQPDEDD